MFDPEATGVRRPNRGSGTASGRSVTTRPRSAPPPEHNPGSTSGRDHRARSAGRPRPHRRLRPSRGTRRRSPYQRQAGEPHPPATGTRPLVPQRVVSQGGRSPSASRALPQVPAQSGRTILIECRRCRTIGNEPSVVLRWAWEYLSRRMSLVGNRLAVGSRTSGATCSTGSQPVTSAQDGHAYLRLFSKKTFCDCFAMMWMNAREHVTHPDETSFHLRSVHEGASPVIRFAQRRSDAGCLFPPKRTETCQHRARTSTFRGASAALWPLNCRNRQ